MVSKNILVAITANYIITAELKFGTIFLKFWKLASNYITKLSIYARHNYEIFEIFGTMLIKSYNDDIINC